MREHPLLARLPSGVLLLPRVQTLSLLRGHGASPGPLRAGGAALTPSREALVGQRPPPQVSSRSVESAVSLLCRQHLLQIPWRGHRSLQEAQGRQHLSWPGVVLVLDIPSWTGSAA